MSNDDYTRNAITFLFAAMTMAHGQLPPSS